MVRCSTSATERLARPVAAVLKYAVRSVAGNRRRASRTSGTRDHPQRLLGDDVLLGFGRAGADRRVPLPRVVAGGNSTVDGAGTPLDDEPLGAEQVDRQLRERLRDRRPL